MGAGGVAESFTAALAQAGLPPEAIFSPSRSADYLVERYAPSAEAVHRLQDLPREADLYLFAIPDQALPRVAIAMPETTGVWMHTAACIPYQVLEACHPASGVFYPLSTFSRGLPQSLVGVPLLPESPHPEVLSLARKLGQRLEMQVVEGMILEDRERIHLAAVFACNFTNHLWSIADELLADKGQSSHILYPLMQATLEKARRLSPKEAQTGPAIRQDRVTIDKHISLLASSPEHWQQLYQLITSSIIDLYHHE